MLEYDGKTGRFTYRLDPSRVTRGKAHKAVVTVTDACGNTSTSTTSFNW